MVQPWTAAGGVLLSSWCLLSAWTSPPLHLWLRLGFLTSRESLVRSARVLNANTNGRLSYVAEWTYGEEEEVAGVLLYVHGGWWQQYDLFAVPSSMQAVARAHGLVLVSAAYRLLSHGATLDEMREDVDAAWRFTEKRYPGRPLLFAGSSAGGTLVLDAVRRRRQGEDATDDRSLALLVDSAATCVPRARADVAASPISVWTWAATSLTTHPDSPVHALKDLCFDDWVPRVPVFVLHSERDIIVPVAQATRYRGNATVCVARRGQHMASLTRACGRALRAWTEERLGRPARRPLAYAAALPDVLFAEILRLLPGMERLALCNTQPYSRWIYDAFCRAPSKKASSAPPSRAES